VSTSFSFTDQRIGNVFMGLSYGVSGFLPARIGPIGHRAAARRRRSPSLDLCRIKPLADICGLAAVAVHRSPSAKQADSSNNNVLDGRPRAESCPF
jgi:hypothetical protein